MDGESQQREDGHPEDGDRHAAERQVDKREGVAEEPDLGGGGVHGMWMEWGGKTWMGNEKDGVASGAVSAGDGAAVQTAAR